MSQPTRGDVHVNRPLTNLSIAFIQDEKRYMAGTIFPEVPVMKQSDRFFEYLKKQWFRANAKKRAPSTESAGGGFKIKNDSTYFADVFAIHMDVSDQIRANQDQPINLDRDATMWVTQQLLLKREIEWASEHFQTGQWTGSTSGGDITPGTKWDAAGSDPVDDVMEQKEAMIEKTSKEPNMLTVTPQVHRSLKSNASILDRVKHTQKAVITEDLLASLFEVEKYSVARATRDLAGEGLAESMQFVFGTEEALLTHAPKSPSILTPSAGYTFVWRGLFGAGPNGNRIKRFRIEEKESDRVEGEMAWDQKRIASDLGVFFEDILT